MALRTLDFEVRADGLDDNDVSFSTVVPSFEVSLGVNSANNNIAVLTETVELDTKINVIDVKLNSTSVSAEEELEFSMYDFIRGKDGQDGKDGKDGRDGRNGTNGQNGRTPVKGVDYWTESDKLEIVNDVVQDPVFKQNYYDKSLIDIKLSNKANAAQAVPTGGTTGQVLAKHSGNDNDVEWIDLQTAVSITYSELKTLRDEGSLITGTLYRITDYHTTVSPLITDARSVDHQFDIIVRADDEYHLNETCYAAHHSGDTYFADCKLEAWKLRYCLDNEKWSKIAGIFVKEDVDYCYLKKLGTVEIEGIIYILWDTSELPEYYEITRAVSEDEEIGTTLLLYDPETGEIVDSNWRPTIASKTEVIGDGQGTILMLEDEHGNQCPYDFKNIQFKRWAVTDSKYGRTGLNGKYMSILNGIPQDLSILDETDFIWAYTFSSDATGGVQSDFSLDEMHQVYGNVLKADSSAFKGLSNNVFYGEYNYNNIIGFDCGFNTFENGCINNLLGSGCYSNAFGNFCSRNCFGSSCLNCSFGTNCLGNTFGNECSNNSLGDNCSYNHFGNKCSSNSSKILFSGNLFGNDCSSNTFNNYFSSNSFGNGCNNNTFDIYFYKSSFGNDCVRNSFGKNCNNISFGNGCSYNTFGNLCKFITVFDNIQYCNITGGTSPNPIRNAQVLNGTSGVSSNNKLTITFESGKNYTQVAGKKTDGTLRIWNVADIDTTPTSGSTNPITSEAVYTAVSDVVHKTGSETITGSKTFDNIVTLGLGGNDGGGLIFEDVVNGEDCGTLIQAAYDDINQEPRLAFYGIIADEPVRLVNIEDPRRDSDAATKGYVDSNKTTVTFRQW